MIVISENDAVGTIKFAIETSLASIAQITAHLPLFIHNGSVRILQLLKDNGVSVEIRAAHVANAIEREDISFILFAIDHRLHPTMITTNCFRRAIGSNNVAFIVYALGRGYKLQKSDLKLGLRFGLGILLRLLRVAEREVVAEFIYELVKSSVHDGILVKIVNGGAWDRIEMGDLDFLARKRRISVLTVIYDRLRLLPSYGALMEAFEKGNEEVFSFIRDRIVEEAKLSPQVDLELFDKVPTAIIGGDLDTIYNALRRGYRPTHINLILGLLTVNLSHGRVLLHFVDDLKPLVRKVLFGCTREVIDNMAKYVDIRVDQTTLDDLAAKGRLYAIKAIYLKEGMTPSIAGYKLAMEEGFLKVAAFIWLIHGRGSSDGIYEEFVVTEFPREIFHEHIDFFAKVNRNLDGLLWLCDKKEDFTKKVMLKAIKYGRMEIIKAILNDKHYEVGRAELQKAVKYHQEKLIREIGLANMDAATDFICESTCYVAYDVIEILRGAYDVAFTEEQIEKIVDAFDFFSSLMW